MDKYRYQIYYKNWRGIWTPDTDVKGKANNKQSLIRRLNHIRRTKANNGQAEIFQSLAK